MKQKTRAQRGLRRISETDCLAAISEENTPALSIRQELYIARRYGLSLAHASVVAEQAFAIPETWGSRT